MHSAIRIVFVLILITLPIGYSAGTAIAEDPAAALLRVQIDLAKKGDPQDEYFLGEMYEKGLGTPVNLEQAKIWYAKAAAKGFDLAAQRLEDLAAESRTPQAENPVADSEPTRPAAAKPAPAPKSVPVKRKKPSAEELAKAQRALDKKRAQWREAMRAQAARNQDPFE